MDPFISIIILIFSVMFHEVAHGYAALYLGDPTAKYADRLTFNPIKHLDLFGSIIIPLIFFISSSGVIFGWAKPVPYNPYNLRNRRWGELFVAIVGPLSNFLLAFLFGLMIRFYEPLHLSQAFLNLAFYVVFINCVLGVFNLVPIPPLDGSKILFAFFPNGWQIREKLEQYGLLIVMLFILLGWQLISPLILYLAQFFTGVSLIF